MRGASVFAIRHRSRPTTLLHLELVKCQILRAVRYDDDRISKDFGENGFMVGPGDRVWVMLR